MSSTCSVSAWPSPSWSTPPWSGWSWSRRSWNCSARPTGGSRAGWTGSSPISRWTHRRPPTPGTSAEAASAELVRRSPAPELERCLVVGYPVDLDPEQRAGPGAGDLQDADGDQHRPADQADRAGVPPGKAERADPSLERQGKDQERNAKAKAIDERQNRPADRGA